MRLASFDPSLKPGVRELARALGRLEEGQGRTARRNARAEVVKALKKIQGKVDKSWPAPGRKKARSRSRLTPEQRLRRFEKNGWLLASWPMLAQFSAVGIRTKRVGVDGLIHNYAPGWAVRIARKHPKKLARAKRDITYRRALLTELALEKDAS